MSNNGAKGSGGASAAAASRFARPVRGAVAFLNGVVVAAAAVGFAGFAVAALLTIADVIGRRIGFPIVGVVDLVQLCVLGGAWLVIPYAFAKNAHVAVDLLLQFLPAGLGRFLQILAGIAAAGLLVLMFRACFDAYSQQVLFGDRSQQLGIPIAWYWLPLLIGVALSVVAALLSILNRVPGTGETQ